MQRSPVIKQMEEKFIRHSDTHFILNSKIGKNKVMNNE